MLLSPVKSVLRSCQLTFRAVFSHNLDLLIIHQNTINGCLLHLQWQTQGRDPREPGGGGGGGAQREPPPPPPPPPPASYFQHKAYRVKFLTEVICFGQRAAPTFLQALCQPLICKKSSQCLEVIPLLFILFIYFLGKAGRGFYKKKILGSPVRCSPCPFP